MSTNLSWACTTLSEGGGRTHFDSHWSSIFHVTKLIVEFLEIAGMFAVDFEITFTAFDAADFE